MNTSRVFVYLFALLAFTGGQASGSAQPSSTEAQLQLRTRIQPYHESGPWVEAHFESTIVKARTAIIITDMWDKHWCAGATSRVAQIAQRMEPVLQEARRAGILIIHSPSDTMNFYANTPGRLLAQNAPQSTLPEELKIKDGPLPIDDSDEGCDTPGDKPHQAWSREHPALTIAPGDVVSDQGAEIFNVLKERHIDTILYMGVHANMCILNRSFGVRQMSKWGFRCIIVRDLMDAMYNPASRPFVSHAAGTELVYEFIEQYWAPSVTSTDLLTGLSSKAPSSSNQ
jgi:nicotinamidase-related amidase